MRDKLAMNSRALDDFRQLPKDEQGRQLDKARQQVLNLRARHILEYESTRLGTFDRDAPEHDWLFATYFFDRFNYWTFIHTDDSTQAFERAITGDFEGAHALFVNSDRNSLNYDSEALLTIFFQDARSRSKPIHGADTLVSFDRARDLLGFEPTVSQV